VAFLWGFCMVIVDDHEKEVVFEALVQAELSHEDQNRNELDEYQEFETNLLSDVEFEELGFGDLGYDPYDQATAQAGICREIKEEFL